MAGGHMLARRFTVLALVVKENIRAERPEKFALILAAEEQRLVDADVPARAASAPKG